MAGMTRALLMALAGQLLATGPALAADGSCDVVQAVVGSYSRNAGENGPLFPKDVRASTRWPSHGRDLLPYIDDFDLSPAEQTDLLKRWADHQEAPWTPDCAWKGRSLKVMEGDMVMTSTFTRPLFSSDGRIAVLSWGLYSPGPWAHGQTCLARLGPSGWKAVCRPSWLT